MQETIVFSKGFSYHAANMLGEGRISPEEVEALAPRIRQAAAGVEKIRKECRDRINRQGSFETRHACDQITGQSQGGAHNQTGRHQKPVIRSLENSPAQVRDCQA